MKSECGNPSVTVSWRRNNPHCLPCLATPKSYRVIRTLGSQDTPIRRELDNIHGISMSFEIAQELATTCLPDLNCRVITSTGQPVTQRVKSYTRDQVSVPFETAQQLACARVPEPHTSIITRAG